MADTMTVGAVLHHIHRSMSEREFQRHVVNLAEQLGWWAYHTWNSQRSNPGFPDLVLVRGRVIYAELKSETGRLSRDQEQVIERLVAAGQTVYVWRPSDYQAICGVLA